MAYFKANQKISDLSKLRLDGWVKGNDTGFEPLDVIFSLKKGYPLFIAGAPHHGKTEFTLELLLYSSILHGWKHFIYLGENGEVEEVIADLCYKYIGKPFKMKSEFSMSESERLQAEMFIDEHFVFLDDSRDYSIKEFHKLALQAEVEYGITFSTTLFDPFNDVVDGTKEFGNRTDLWLTNDLKEVRRTSKKYNRIDILVNHIADIQTITDKGTGNRYMPPALPNEWSGGRTWWRRAFGMLLIYRPPKWLRDENGNEYGENVTLVFVQKAKPKGIGKLGVAKIMWDWKKNRYFWEDSFGNYKNIFEKGRSGFVPVDFTQSKKETDDAPF